MVTTPLCDDGQHKWCDATAFVHGRLREGQHATKHVWVEVPCQCECHGRASDATLVTERVA